MHRGWLVLILATLFAVPAHAQDYLDGAVWLSWDDCKVAPAAHSDTTFDCATGTPPTRLVASFRPDVAIPDFSGLVVHLTIPLAPDWWKLQDGACRSGALSIGDPASASCANPYENATTNTSTSMTLSKYASLDVTIEVTLTQPRALTAGSTYVAAVLEVAGATAQAVAACAGCSQPTCIGLQGITLRSPSQGSRHLIVRHDGDLGFYVTWQGGVTSCAGLVPVRARSWGEVKAHYR